MATRTGWLIGQPMERKFYSLPPVKVARRGSINFIRCRLTVGSLKNFRWPMLSLDLILPTENKLLLYFARKLVVTGNVIVAEPKPTSIFSISQIMNPKRSEPKLMQVM